MQDGTQQNNEQVDKPVEETKVESTVEGSEEQSLDSVGKLLREEPTETQETKEVQETEETQEEVKPVSEPVVDDTLIKEYPVLKMYRGKPLKDLAKAYQSIVSRFTKTNQLLEELKRKTENDSLPDISTMPDPIEKPEEAKKWLKDRDEAIRKQVPQQQQQAPNVVSEIQRKLPENADIQKVVDGWTTFNSERIFNELGEMRPEVQAFYSENPHVLVNEVVSYYNLLSKAEKNEVDIQVEAKKKAAKDMTNAFKQAQKNKDNMPNAQANAVQRTTELTPEEELLARIGILAKQE